MKTIFLVLISAFLLPARAQVITREDFISVIPYVEREDYKKTYDLTGKLLSDRQNDSSDLRAIITYMNLYAAAGMVTKDEMTFKEFTKQAKKYVGQRVVMAAHPCVDSASMVFNSLTLHYPDGLLQGASTVANKTGTNILFFEKFNYDMTFYPLEFIGDNVRCGGILEEVTINPNGSKIWIARLTISKAFIRKA